MHAYLLSADFLTSLMNYASKLSTRSWDVIPMRFHASKYVHDRWGRVGIRFETNDWRPALTVGFLYNVADHKVKLTNPSRGIDLMLRLEADPEDTKKIEPVLTCLAERRKALKKSAASVLLKGEPGNGNPYSVLIIQQCLGDLIEGAASESEQLAAIYKRLTKWLTVLFGDGQLEKSLKKCRLDSGMK
jgi:hypothetical protein